MTEKKHKNIAFVSNTSNEQAQIDLETNEGIFDVMVLLGRQFNNILKNILFDISRNSESQRRDRNDDKTNQGKGVHCHGCEGFGHFKAECPTHLKRQKKGLSISRSDDDVSENEPDDENSNHVIALTERYESEEGVSYDELVDSYKELCVRSEEVIKIGENHKRIIAQLRAEKNKLLSTNSDLHNEVTLLSFKLKNMTKSIRMLNNGSDTLDEILLVGKNAGNVQGIWFNYKHLNKQGKTHVTKFIPFERKYDSTMSDNMSRHPDK